MAAIPHVFLDLQSRDMKLIFVWSQMLVIDELKVRKRAVGLKFFDFVEALARLADFISPPSLEVLHGDHDEPLIAPSAAREMASDGHKASAPRRLDAKGDGAVAHIAMHPLEDFLKSEG